jgi:hypothetical protein
MSKSLLSRIENASSLAAVEALATELNDLQMVLGMAACSIVEEHVEDGDKIAHELADGNITEMEAIGQIQELQLEKEAEDDDAYVGNDWDDLMITVHCERIESEMEDL